MPFSIAEDVVAISSMSKADAERVINALDNDDQVYYRSHPDALEQNRVKLISFSDGKQGALIIHEDPSHFTLVAGDMALDFYEQVAEFDFNDWDRPAVSVRDIAEFGAENEPSLHL